jgi:hypothetical protein
MKLKKLFILLFCVVLHSGCAVTSVKVTTRNAAARRPASRILVVYLDESCDLSRFDSNLYNICLRSCFRNPESLELRTQQEIFIENKLASPGLSVINATDLFDTVNNSYAYFTHCIDKYAFDGIFVAGMGVYEHAERTHAIALPGGGLGTEKQPVLNGALTCYFFYPGSIGLPVWTAEVGSTGAANGGKNSLNRKMTREVAATLKASGYIAH